MNTTPAKSTSGILLSDIPQEYRQLTEALGLNAFLRLAALRGGQDLYIPKLESLERNARDRRIRAAFRGRNYRELAARFHLSERQIRKILKGSGRQGGR